MKKLVLLTVFSVFLLASKSEAQGFRFITSFGVEQHWDVPYEVYYTLDHYYHGYDWVHARRVYDRGTVSFDVILHRGDAFVSVRLDRSGRIFRRVVDYHYPLHNHVCNDFCGFQADYYASYRTYCGSPHHHGHNHVVYRPVVVNKHYHHPKGNAYGYHKNKSHHKSYDNNRYQNRRSGSVKVVSNYEKSRLNTNRGGSGHGHGSGYDRGGKGNSGKGYSRGGNKGNNGNAYGRGKDKGKGNGLGRGRDDRSRSGKEKSTRIRTTYRSRSDK